MKVKIKDTQKQSECLQDPNAKSLRSYTEITPRKCGENDPINIVLIYYRRITPADAGKTKLLLK